MTGPRGLVLSLFPGADLFGAAFEEAGFTVVRGPDAIFAGDVRRMHVPPGRFDGIIGGPPCQTFSSASRFRGTTAVDLIPEFFRIVDEARPAWWVMENVPVKPVRSHPSIPAGCFRTVLSDWDCGGFTVRRRFFASTFPIVAPPKRDGGIRRRVAGGASLSVTASTAIRGRRKHPVPSVMASTWKRGRSKSGFVEDKSFLPGDQPVEFYARLQGADAISAALKKRRASKAFIVFLLGNGVPLAMGRTVAAHAVAHVDKQ